MNTGNPKEGLNQDPDLVLIVDDEEDITTFLSLALEDAGYRVETANDATSALEIIRADPPDLVCLDLLMPEKTGASLFREIRRDPTCEATPVLIMSGLGARDELDTLLAGEGIQHPAGYLEKPVEIEPFLAIVAELLSRRHETTGQADHGPDGIQSENEGGTEGSTENGNEVRPAE